MKFYFHPVSTTCRPIMMLAADEGIPLENVVVDLFTGEHMRDPYSVVNPSKQVPAIQDGDFCLTESSAILKYLADKVNSPAYPKDLQKRARVNERMDWLNTGFYRDFGYGLVYPQLFPHHKRATDEAHKGTIDWGKEQCKRWFGVFDKMIGSHKYVCGDALTIADYWGADILAAGDLIGTHFSQYANITRWMNTMRALPNLKKTHEAHEGMVQHIKGGGQQFVTL